MGNDGIAVHTHDHATDVPALRIRPFLALSGIVLPLIWVYSRTLLGLIGQWTSDDNYSHGFLVVPLATYFVWERRGALATAVARPSGLGLVAFALSLLMFVIGTLGAELFLTRVSLIGVLAGTVLLLYGPTHLRIVAFPLAFLLLMVPLPAIVFNQIAFPLQLLASRVGTVGIQACAVPVLREGNVIVLADTSLEVAEACSGIRSLVSLLTLGILYGYFTDPRPWMRTVIALATVPIAIAANAVRVTGTGVLAHYYGAEAAHGFFHTFSGWLVFLVAFLLLFITARVLETLAPPRSQESGTLEGAHP